MGTHYGLLYTCFFITILFLQRTFTLHFLLFLSFLSPFLPFFLFGFVVVKSLCRACLFAIPWTAAPQASLSFIISWSLLNLMSIDLVMPSNRVILCRPLLLLPSILSSIGVFSNESALCIRWPKYWSFSFSICPSSEYSGLISYSIDWFDSRIEPASPALQADSLRLSHQGSPSFCLSFPALVP